MLGMVIVLLRYSTLSEAHEKAAAREVTQKVQEAAKSVSSEAGLAQFDKRESPWVGRTPTFSSLTAPKEP